MEREGERIWGETGFSSSTFVVHCQYQSASSPQSHFIHPPPTWKILKLTASLNKTLKRGWKRTYSSAERLIRIYSILILRETSRIILIFATDLQSILRFYNRSCPMVDGELS